MQTTEPTPTESPAPKLTARAGALVLALAPVLAEAAEEAAEQALRVVLALRKLARDRRLRVVRP